MTIPSTVPTKRAAAEEIDAAFEAHKYTKLSTEEKSTRGGPRLPSDLELPELPIIRNKTIEEQVFTHISFHGKPRGGLNYHPAEGDVLLDNEKLEWVGDGILS